MLNTDEVMEMIKRQIDQWDKEGVLEEKLIEHGFEIKDYNPETPTKESDSE